MSDKTFDGWRDGSGTEVTAQTIVTSTSDHSLAAAWKDKTYQVGDIGPAGGHIFYTRSSDDDWMYLEAAPTDLSGTYIFGHFMLDNGIFIGADPATSQSIGEGENNTLSLVAQMGDSARLTINMYNNETTSSYAAKVCDDLVSGGYDDWFLPSRDELIQLNEVSALSGEYWSSTDYSADGAFILDVDAGHYDTSLRAEKCKVRAVRAFR